MKAGDLIYDNFMGMPGILIQRDWHTDIGTPFDWLILYFDGQLWGADDRHVVAVELLAVEL